MYPVQYDDNSNIETTNLHMSKRRRQDALKAEHKAPITEDCYIPSKLFGGTDCKILLDKVANNLSMSKTFYLNFSSLHYLSKFVSKTKNILVGNGQHLCILFFHTCCDEFTRT